jgi:2-dehydropantoate 2-reductase
MLSEFGSVLIPAQLSLKVKIAIIGGTGALGQVIGAAWSELGHEITLVGRNEATIRDLNSTGFRVRNVQGVEKHFSFQASSDFQSLDRQDLIVISVKSFDTGSVVPLLDVPIVQASKILSIQNGLSHQALLKATVPLDQLLFGVTFQAATRISGDTVLHASIGLTTIGSASSDITSATLLAGVLDSQTAPCVSTDHIELATWEKICLNICTMPASVIFRLKTRLLLEHVEARTMMHRLLHETVNIGLAAGLDLNFEDRWSTALTFLAKAGDGKSSMLQDFEAGRPLEYEAITGALIQHAKLHKVRVPHLVAAHDALRRNSVPRTG